MLGPIAGNIDAKEATYTIWIGAPNDPTDWKPGCSWF